MAGGSLISKTVLGWRVLAAAAVGALAGILYAKPQLGTFDLHFVAIFLSGLFFGPVGLAAAAGAFLAVEQTLGHQEFLDHPGLLLTYVAVGCSVHLIFSRLPGFSRGLRNFRSYLAILAVGAFGGLLVGVVGSFSLFSELKWGGVWFWFGTAATSLLLLVPPCMIGMNRVFGRIKTPMPEETRRRSLPGRRRGLNAVLIAGLLLLATVVGMWARILGPGPEDWLKMFYLAPILWASFHQGLRGGVLAGSAAGLLYLLGSGLLSSGGSNLGTHMGSLAHMADLLIFAVIGAGTGAFRDSRVDSEARLRESEARYRLLAENASEIIMTLGREGRMTYLSPSIMPMLGYSPAELAGTSLHDLMTDTTPADADEVLSKVLSYRPDKDTLEHCRPCLVQVDLRRQDGSAVPVEATFGPLVDETGTGIGILGVFRNIHRRRQTELALRDSEERLRQSQRLEAVGQLAGGVAHDFNNLLTVILGNLDLLQLDHNLGESGRQSLEEIRTAADRAASVTKQLLAFSRKQALSEKVIEIKTVVTDVTAMLDRVIGETIKLITTLDPGSARLRADPVQVEQAILNLAINARDAMPEGGTLEIATSTEHLTENDLTGQRPMEPGDYVRLTVRDSGTGMDDETMARVFEPFFTTKEKSKGSGLGLATVYGIVKQSQGFIWVDSAVGEGTSFSLYFPAVAEPVTEEEERAPLRRPPARGRTILVVEDEAPVRQLMRRILELQGYRVLLAGQGLEAIEMVAREDAPIDLVLTDVVMPEMSGLELAERLRSDDSDLKVVFMTGYLDDTIDRESLRAVSDGQLEKPFSPEALSVALAEVLGA